MLRNWRFFNMNRFNTICIISLLLFTLLFVNSFIFLCRMIGNRELPLQKSIVHHLVNDSIIKILCIPLNLTCYFF